ncbi:MAG: AraC family transcriptional regulator [Alphaproteobacteria bacterium]|nr:AraC family transcriptional regulator [Alphaproteobacteria bacterium]
MNAVNPRPRGPVVLRGSAGRILFAPMTCGLVSHVHREHQVIFHCGGTATAFRVDGVVHPLRPGEMILVDPWQHHEKLASPGGASVLLSVLFDPAETTEESPVATGARSVRHAHGRVPPPLRCALDAAVRALTTAQMPAAAGADAALAALVRAIIDTCLERDAGPEAPALARPYDFRIQRAFQFILRSGRTDLRVDDLPALAGMSRSHFFRQFRRCLGVSPHNVIDYVQITAAIEKLAACGQPIGAIARDLGFTTTSHFARFFANHLGTSPRRYRHSIFVV